MIIGKSNIEQSKYNCLFFCVRNIKQITIPNFIEHICSNSFNCCVQLEIICFSDDSKLQIIGEDAFTFSMIKSIRFPSSVTSIGEGSFADCEQLCIIEAGNLKIISMFDSAFLDCSDALLLMISAHS